MISRLVHAEEDGDILDEDEILATVFLMFLAGHVTTVNLIGNGVVALLTHPEQLAKLKADPELAKGVVEETLRYWGPVDFIGRRIAKEDVEVGGTVIPTGEQVDGQPRLGQPRSRRASPNPDAFDITRADANRHVAFGKGIHVCLGAPLARVEGQVAFDTLFRRFPDLRLAVPAEEVRWGSSFLRGFAQPAGPVLGPRRLRGSPRSPPRTIQWLLFGVGYSGEGTRGDALQSELTLGLADELNIAPLGVGAWAWGSTRLWGYGKEYNRSDVERAFRASMAQGVTLIDTAEMYGGGASERIIGEILREGGFEGTPVIATKFAPLPYRFSAKSLLTR